MSALLASTVVIPTLNEENYLPSLLNSFKKVRAPLQIIIVDGHSEDKTAAIVETEQAAFTGDASLQLIQSPERNISFQRNLGAAKARHNLLVFCDADLVVPSAKSYESLLQKFVEQHCVAAAPRLVPLEPGLKYKSFYTTFYFIQRFLMLFNRPYFAGSCMVTTKDTFVSLGGFDPTIMLGEDVDYSLRAAKRGRCALFTIPFPVSARRIIKYGFKWAYEQVPNLIRFAFTGRVVPDTIYYPFGEFGNQKAHHVTKNRGRITS